MECPNCGASLPDDASFCSECGSPLAAPSPTAPAPEDPYTTPQTVSQSPAFSWRDGEAATAATVELPKADAASKADEQPVTAPGASEPAVPESDLDATRVVDPLSDFGTTIEDAETEPAYHADLGSTPLSEKEQLEQDRESLKTAKAEYKLARKRLGKSYAPAIAAGVIVVAALCAGAGWAGYSYGLAHPQNTEQIQKLKKQLESSKDELTKTQDELDQTKSDLKDAKAELKTASKNGEDASSDAEDSSTTGDATSSTSGSTAKINIDKPTSFANTTWRGTLKETDGSWGHTCYGGSKNDLVIVFKSISDSGQVVADISATLHAHDTYNAEKTIDHSDGDDYRTYTDVTGTFVKNKGFEFSLPVEEEDCDLTVTGVPKKKNGKYYLDTEVVSRDSAVNMGTSITDSFELLIS